MDPSKMACIILAGGQGKRMASARLHKVCFPIAGKPAIVRAVDTYKAAGLRRFLIVVGQKADQVMATLSAVHDGLTFVYQAQPRGTGHAAAVAIDALAAEGYDGPCMIVMGDKVTHPDVVRRLIAEYSRRRPDVLLTVLPKQAESTAGRVVVERGAVRGIVEAADLEQLRRRGRKLSVGGRSFTAAQIDRASDTVNASMYVFDFAKLQQALREARADTAQGEIYLTDTVEPLAAKGKAETLLVEDPTDLMAFNTPAELLAIEQAIRLREKPPRVSLVRRRSLRSGIFKSAGEWLAAVRDNGPRWRNTLRRNYGADSSLHAERTRAITDLLKAFIKQYGPDRQTVLVRTPGRINLMGRHVDHRGGYVNVMAIGREVLLAAAPREDDVVALRNVNARRFPPREFRIGDLLEGASWSDWIDFVNSQAVREHLAAGPGDWSHYARAPMLRLQHEARGVRLKGMDCMVTGNIPMAAGLSSSSALVVAFAEATVALNRLNVVMRDFVDLCGEGEWFVGSRGGSADHAAIRASRIGHVSRIGFFPFHLDALVPFPPDLRVVVAYSGAQAAKSAGARDTFNQRVACYELAQLLLRRDWPAAAGAAHLRDLTPRNLGVTPADVYRALLRLPVRPTRRTLSRLLGRAYRDDLERIFATHAEMGPYDLRGVALYGLGEIERSDRFAELLRKGDWDTLSRHVRTSHDGDRGVRFDSRGVARRFVVNTGDAALRSLAANDTDLAEQPGRYACSIEPIDRLVDLANRTDDVLGAQLAGAGFGGCMMVIVRARRVERLLETLRCEFYQPRGLEFAGWVCSPSAGTALLEA